MRFDLWSVFRVFRPFEMRLEASVLSTVRRKVERPGFYIVHRNQQVLVKLVSTRLINSYGVSVASPAPPFDLPPPSRLHAPRRHRLHLRSGHRHWYWYRSGSGIGMVRIGYGSGIGSAICLILCGYRSRCLCHCWCSRPSSRHHAMLCVYAYLLCICLRCCWRCCCGSAQHCDSFDWKNECKFIWNFLYITFLSLIFAPICIEMRAHSFVSILIFIWISILCCLTSMHK